MHSALEMTDNFLKIAFTLPSFRQNEADEIVYLLNSGFDRVHIRKPDCEAAKIQQLLREIPTEYYSRLTLHQHPEVVSDLREGWRLGFQINSRLEVPPQTNSFLSNCSQYGEYGEDPLPDCTRTPQCGEGQISVSCHSLGEAELASRDKRIAYQTLSPIFDSISKEGYLSKFADLSVINIPAGTVALGGVTPDKFNLLRKCGFAGAALLGWVWTDSGPRGLGG